MIRKYTPLLCIALLSGGVLANAKPQPKAKAKPAAAKIYWRASYAAARAEAKKTKKPIFIDFYTTWCGPCKLLDKHTYTDKNFIQESKRWIMVKVDAEKNKQSVKLAQDMGVTGYPTMTLLRPDGTQITALSGYWSAGSLVKEMRKNEKLAR